MLDREICCYFSGEENRLARRWMSIRRDCRNWKQALVHAMNEPFSKKQCAATVVSYDVSASGYNRQIMDESRLSAMPIAQPPP